MAEPTVQLGDIVLTMDFYDVGKIDRIEPGSFRVATTDGVLWAGNDAVFTRTHGRVTLVCNRTGLASYLHRR